MNSKADIDHLLTWSRYRQGLCHDCHALCCTMPVEVTVDDLVQLGALDEFEKDYPLPQLFKYLKKQGVVKSFSLKDGRFILAQHYGTQCRYLDHVTRKCSVYDRRPKTCREHPQIGPRPGHCPYTKRH